jgi:hypothetical protein
MIYFDPPFQYYTAEYLKKISDAAPLIRKFSSVAGNAFPNLEYHEAGSITPETFNDCKQRLRKICLRENTPENWQMLADPELTKVKEVQIFGGL